MFCGWDWGSTVHGVCLIDDEGAVIKRWMVQHTDEQLMKVFYELAELAGGRPPHCPDPPVPRCGAGPGP